MDDQPKKFVDSGITLEDFRAEILVHCPSCDARAVVRVIVNPKPFGLRRIVCPACGYSKESKQICTLAGQVRPDPYYDDFVHLRLWLQASCCGHILWAYNAEHLAFVRDYVSAKLRSSSPDPAYGYRNQSLASRLPKWLIAARHREEVLRTIEGLQQRL